MRFLQASARCNFFDNNIVITYLKILFTYRKKEKAEAKKLLPFNLKVITCDSQIFIEKEFEQAFLANPH